MKWDDVKLDQAILGRRTVRTVEFPGAPHIKFGVRMLLDAEIDGCKRRALEVCKKDGAEAVIDYFARVLDREIIAEAFVDLDTVGRDSKEPEPFFADQKHVAELDASVITQLAVLYQEHCKDADPLVYMDEEGVGELIDRLGKGLCSRVLLSGFEHETLVSLCASLASTLPEKSQPPKSPTGAG